MMKLFYIVCILCFSIGTTSAQDITGLWKGTLYNDSNRLVYNYEIAISRYKGKLEGYSHTWFILDQNQYYGVKKVRVLQTDEMILIEDDGLIANNYPVKPAKNVRQLNKLQFKDSAGIAILYGPYSTNRVGRYSPLTGYIRLTRIPSDRENSLIPHLQELSLVKNLSFIPDSLKTVVTTGKNTPQPAKVLSVKERENVVQHQTVYTTDSLHFTLYDNGEVDGDSVSVYINDVPVITKARLSTVPVKFSIPTNTQKEIKVVMYAESLGSIPPNTGLMVVQDGKHKYELRFSGNLSQNAVVIFEKNE